MALQYGLNFLSSDAASLLEKNDKQQNGVRTWRELFGNASLGNAAATDNLTTKYSDAIAEAYKANFEQNNAIMGSGLSTGTTKSLLAMSRDELRNTYQNYLSNYSQNLNQLNTDYTNEIAAIYEGLNERAENFNKLYSSAYDYLASELVGATLTDESGNATNYLSDYGLEWLYDDAGNLMTWDQLSPLLFDADTGEINETGRDFFVNMFNALPQGYQSFDAEGNVYNTRSFDKWLSDTNAELRDWWASGDEFNYTFAGTNKGTAQTLIGANSTESLPSTPTIHKVNGVGDLVTEYDDMLKNEILKSEDYYKANVEKLATRTAKSWNKYQEEYNQFVQQSKNDTKNVFEERIEKLQKALGSTFNDIIESEEYKAFSDALDTFLNNQYTITRIPKYDNKNRRIKDDERKRLFEESYANDTFYKDIHTIENLYRDLLEKANENISIKSDEKQASISGF